MRVFSVLLILLFSSKDYCMGIHPYSLGTKSSIRRFCETKSLTDLYGCPFLFIAQSFLGSYHGGEAGLSRTFNGYQVSEEDILRYTIKISDVESEEEKVQVIHQFAKELLDGKWKGNKNDCSNGSSLDI